MLETSLRQFSLGRLLVATALLSAACWFFTDFSGGTMRSLVDAPAFLAMIAAALTALIGKARQVCFVAAATFILLPVIIGGGCLLLALGLR
ncbi:MAG: hypothetical protein ACREHD_23025 [Pirellulales bacterium]